MTDSHQDDLALLIDFVLGQCPAQLADQVRGRLTEEPEFQELHDSVADCFAAISLAPDYEPPPGLAERTVAGIRQKQRVDALITREEAARPTARRVFSLRELTTVAAVLLILAAVFIPSVRQAQYAALTNQCESNVGRIGAAMLAYANENDDFLPGVQGSPTQWLADGQQPAASNSAALFKLVKGEYVSPVVFQCPAVGGGSFAVQAGFVDFPASQYVSYSYQHTIGHNSLCREDLKNVADDMAILADSTPVFEGGRFSPDRLKASASKNHKRRGQNVLYLDGSVRWSTDASAGVGGDNIFLASGVYEYDGDERPTGATDTFLLPNYTANKR